MNATGDWMLYGAYGFTGQRIAREAVRRGMRPILAGRRAAKLEPLAGSLGCPVTVFPLDDAAQIASKLAGCRLVLHSAGPFSATSQPMLDACLRAGVHYLDITGEVEVIEAAATRHEEAVASKIAVIPAIGFDVVPTDCLAAMLAQRLPGATYLRLAFGGVGPPSPGTTNTMIERLRGGCLIRRDGRIERVPLAWKTLDVPFREGLQPAATIPWGDVATAWHSTGIPNVEVYMAMPRAQIYGIRLLRSLFPVLALPGAKRLIRPILRRMVGRRTGQSEGRSSFWGGVSDSKQTAVEATLTGPDAYRLTVLTALATVEKVLAGQAPAGFSTPSKAFGPEFILGIPDVELQWTKPPPHGQR